MKDDWENPSTQNALTEDQIRKAVRVVFPGCNVLSFVKLGHGLSNSNYKIWLKSASKPFVLRIYNGKKGIAVKEQNISRLISKTVPVAEYQHVDESCIPFNVPFAILEWKEGILLSELLRTGNWTARSSSAESVGGTLAEIHKYKFPEYGFLNERLEVKTPMKMDREQFLSLIRHFLDSNCGALLGEKISNDLWNVCKLQGYNLSEENGEPCLVHSDFNGLNILIDNSKDGAFVSAVLDWEFTFSGSIYTDFGNVLRYEEEGSDFETHLMDGYESRGGVVKDNWRILAKLHDLVALCDLLERSSQDTPRRVLDLKKSIKQITTQLG